MKRQLDDYFTKFYCPLAERRQVLFADNYKKAKEIAAWKELVASRWDCINVVSCQKEEDILKGDVFSGKKYKMQYIVDEQGLDDAVGMELVTVFKDEEGREHISQVEPLEVVKREGNLYTFEGTHVLPTAGSFKVACRMYPKSAELPHRQDFCYVKWVD
jgi:starch phosphorylase